MVDGQKRHYIGDQDWKHQMESRYTGPKRMEKYDRAFCPTVDSISWYMMTMLWFGDTIIYSFYIIQHVLPDGYLHGMRHVVGLAINVRQKKHPSL